MPNESHTQVAVDHLNMLISLVEEMTCKWERQLEDSGEGKWTDDMLAREGTDGERKQAFSIICTDRCVQVRHDTDGVSAVLPLVFAGIVQTTDVLLYCPGVVHSPPSRMRDDAFNKKAAWVGRG